MIHENEILMLLLGIAVLLFVLANYTKLKQLRSFWYLASSFIFSVFGWFFTILEGFMLPADLNTLEHLSYLISALFIVAWIFVGNKSGTSNDSSPHFSA